MGRRKKFRPPQLGTCAQCGERVMDGSLHEVAGGGLVCMLCTCQGTFEKPTVGARTANVMADVNEDLHGGR